MDSALGEAFSDLTSSLHVKLKFGEQGEKKSCKRIIESNN